MHSEPIIFSVREHSMGDYRPVVAIGTSFSIQEWRGSGPAYLHVHYADDEAWHVLDGTIRFRFSDRQVDVAAGGTVFVPAGVPHAYEATEDARYLIILPPRLSALIVALHGARDVTQHATILRQFDSEIVE